MTSTEYIPLDFMDSNSVCIGNGGILSTKNADMFSDNYTFEAFVKATIVEGDGTSSAFHHLFFYFILFLAGAGAIGNCLLLYIFMQKLYCMTIDILLKAFFLTNLVAIVAGVMTIIINTLNQAHHIDALCRCNGFVRDTSLMLGALLMDAISIERFSLIKSKSVPSYILYAARENAKHVRKMKELYESRESMNNKWTNGQRKVNRVTRAKQCQVPPVALRRIRIKTYSFILLIFLLSSAFGIVAFMTRTTITESMDDAIYATMKQCATKIYAAKELDESYENFYKIREILSKPLNPTTNDEAINLMKFIKKFDHQMYEILLEITANVDHKANPSLNVGVCLVSYKLLNKRTVNIANKIAFVLIGLSLIIVITCYSAILIPVYIHSKKLKQYHNKNNKKSRMKLINLIPSLSVKKRQTQIDSKKDISCCGCYFYNGRAGDNFNSLHKSYIHDSTHYSFQVNDQSHYSIDKNNNNNNNNNINSNNNNGELCKNSIMMQENDVQENHNVEKTILNKSSIAHSSDEKIDTILNHYHQTNKELVVTESNDRTIDSLRTSTTISNEKNNTKTFNCINLCLCIFTNYPQPMSKGKSGSTHSTMARPTCGDTKNSSNKLTTRKRRFSALISRKKKMSTNVQLAIILLSVAIVYFSSTIPLFIFTFMENEETEYIFYIYLLNNTIAPFIYGFSSKYVRDVFVYKWYNITSRFKKYFCQKKREII
ncbi:hypothetical protein SNEBB_005050 [Seison nebaliae]|nr:hypothetical protein SNEBB_005050 [Seison nebaliae]